VMENIERSTRTLQALRRLGVNLSLDDFGTGYSSLSYVQRLPVSKLKIDRSFVAQLGISREAEAIVLATLAMARSLGLDVVAEGVETPAQSQQLRALGCPQQQGFLFTPALSAAKLDEWLTATGRAPPAA
jgi:EAL domain-containing protein (putative c-di-GMP-specific phosphodiesterase class I)